MTCLKSVSDWSRLATSKLSGAKVEGAGRRNRVRLRSTYLGHVLCDNVEPALLLHNHTQ